MEIAFKKCESRYQSFVVLSNFIAFLCFVPNIFSKITRGGSSTAATSTMERLVIIVNSFQPLTIITKHSIVDVAAVLDPPLIAKFYLEWTCNPWFAIKRQTGTERGILTMRQYSFKSVLLSHMVFRQWLLWWHFFIFQGSGWQCCLP